MLELATLGMLLKEPLHGYRLKSWLERYMGATITVNYGAIYPLLRRLKNQGCIESSEKGGPGLPRTTYSITEEGRRRWHHEMLSQPRESWVNARSRFMTKFYFFGWLGVDERVLLLERRLAACHLRRAELDGRDDPLDAFQQQIMDLARAQLANEVTWLEAQLELQRGEAQPRKKGRR
jgi:DNA-binding PadR family transcriptional regulator